MPADTVTRTDLVKAGKSIPIWAVRPGSFFVWKEDLYLRNEDVCFFYEHRCDREEELRHRIATGHKLATKISTGEIAAIEGRTVVDPLYYRIEVGPII